jgi:hypothetical protein
LRQIDTVFGSETAPFIVDAHFSLPALLEEADRFSLVGNVSEPVFGTVLQNIHRVEIEALEYERLYIALARVCPHVGVLLVRGSTVFVGWTAIPFALGLAMAAVHHRPRRDRSGGMTIHLMLVEGTDRVLKAVRTIRVPITFAEALDAELREQAERLAAVDPGRLRRIVHALASVPHPGPLLMARAHVFAVADGPHARALPRCR